MLSDKDVVMQVERYKDLRRQVERDAQVRQALAGRPRGTPLALRAIAALRNCLVAAWKWANPRQHELRSRPVRRRA